MSNHDSSFKRNKPPKLKKISSRVFIRFGSTASFQQFQTQRQTGKAIQKLKKTSEDQTNKQLSETMKLHKISTVQSYQQNKQRQPIRKYQCQKCSAKLYPQQQKEGICSQCARVDELVSNNNFQQFVLYVMDFKMNKLPSYSSATKLRRISSIQSIQSLVMDRPNQSVLKPANSKSKESSKRFNFVSKGNVLKESKPFLISRRIDGLENTQTLTSGGYFCNECGASPIEGNRFHCLTCSDFDLCERCYYHSGHRHEMKICPGDRQKEIKQLREQTLKQTLNLNDTFGYVNKSIKQFSNISKDLFATFQLQKKDLPNK